MTYFIFSIFGLITGLMVGLTASFIRDINTWERKWVEYAKTWQPKQQREENGRFVSKKDIMTKKLKMELGRD